MNRATGSTPRNRSTVVAASSRPAAAQQVTAKTSAGKTAPKTPLKAAAAGEGGRGQGLPRIRTGQAGGQERARQERRQGRRDEGAGQGGRERDRQQARPDQDDPPSPPSQVGDDRQDRDEAGPAKSATKAAAPTTKAPAKPAAAKASGKAATAKGPRSRPCGTGGGVAVDEAGAALVVVGADEVVEVDVEVELATLEPDPEALATVDGEATPEGEEPEAEDEGFVLSDVDDTDEPIQQVQVAGATADPVKDYLKQIGKVPLLNAEQEVELAKRIEAGLFAEEKLAAGIKQRQDPRASTSGSPRTAGAPRTTCSRPTSGWSSRSPSVTPAAACSSST